MEAKTLLAISHEVSLSSKYEISPILNLPLKGVFAGTVGIPRLLKLFDKYDIKTTFFIPALFGVISGGMCYGQRCGARDVRSDFIFQELFIVVS